MPDFERRSSGHPHARASWGSAPHDAPKILAGRCADTQLRGDQVEVRVDHVILSRSPNASLVEALEIGLKKTPVELAVVYDTVCVTQRLDGPPAGTTRSSPAVAGGRATPDVSGSGILVARPGIGFPASVHLERFASPARLAVTDDPRLAMVGGAGTLVLVVSPGQLGQALALGTVSLRPPRTVQILLTGKMRPFVCARDVALELLRRDLHELVERIEAQHHAPVVLEFAGPSARLLSVAERSVLCGMAPAVGAAAALFVSDEKTEVFLRDQRRSKAHRALIPDPGAPCEDVVSLDLGTVDPLLRDETGVVRPVRDLAGKPVAQVMLGGDTGCTLRDLLAAAALLKSKRVPPRLDFLLAPPSRQALEVLGQAGALVDLIATGARIIEPDRRVLSGELYPPPEGGLSLRTLDPEPRLGPGQAIVASAETLAYAVATGTIGDPRSFKRPVRVTVPRTLPTDDVLVVKERRAEASAKRPAPPPLERQAPWEGSRTLELVFGLPLAGAVALSDQAVVVGSVEEVTLLAGRVCAGGRVRAVIAPFIPSGLVPLFCGAGVLALGAEAATWAALKEHPRIHVAAVTSDAVVVTGADGTTKLPLSWLAVGVERGWTLAGTSRPTPQTARARTP